MTDLPSLAAYLSRIGAEPRSLRVAVVKECHGAYWSDIAIIRVQKDGAIDAPEGYAPTENEAVIIRGEVLGAEWPTNVKLGQGYELPDELKQVSRDDIFELKDRSGQLIMLQVRTDVPKTGEKRYVPWTYWSDNQWRKAEPEGNLPLYGLDTIGDHTTVFIHEGAKAARAVARLIEPRTEDERKALLDHPWGKELGGAAHLGWIGGALSPARTDWSELAKAGVNRVYIVADNDRPGKAAIPKIAQRLRGITVFSIEFTEVWPASFDLADPFPKKMFNKIGSLTYYNGPSFRDVLHPATWATDVVPNPNGKGKPVTVLRPEFSDLWIWIEESDTFICREMPEMNHALAQFNSTVASFSHILNTGQLIQKTYKGRIAKICYRPDLPQRIVTDRTTSAINLHTPTDIRPADGDAKPWEDFLDYLFTVERERNEVKRWCATLIARPDVRMLYGMLLVSERQGMGKSTLGERILAPLVGPTNTGFPGERDIVESNFNGWIANKRLIVVGEIYTGQSFKAYNILKSYLTDKNINVNEKFQRPYTIENWAHVLACSNSKKALRIEESDRRWFYPQLNETPWTREQWGEFYQWLNGGGLSVIMRWAQEYGSYVLPGEHAPMTISKGALIRDSKGEVLNHWMDIMESVEIGEEVVAFALNDVRDALRKRHGKIYESPLDFRREAVRRGWFSPQNRMKFAGGMSYVVLSPALANGNRVEAMDPRDQELKEAIRGSLKNLEERLSELH
jgi:hypothetical protein